MTVNGRPVQDSRILFGWKPPEVAGADVARTLTNDVGLVFVSVAHHERIVDRHISALSIFYEKRNVGHLVKKHLQQGDVDRRQHVSNAINRRSCAAISRIGAFLVQDADSLPRYITTWGTALEQQGFFER